MASYYYKNALKNLVVYYQATKLKERHKFVKPIRDSGLNYSDIRELGYPISRYLWDTCENSSERNKGKKPL